MILSEVQMNNMMRAVREGLRPLIRPLPMTAVEWADKYYFLPKESSYGAGDWVTLPFQVGIMNAMGSDLIRTINLIKSARVGAADIRQRVAEWEEEALALSGDEGDGSDGNIIDGELITRTEEKPAASGWRRVKARQTFHAHAREVDSDRRKELILLDEVVRVPEAVLARLIAAGLVDEY